MPLKQIHRFIYGPSCFLSFSLFLSRFRAPHKTLISARSRQVANFFPSIRRRFLSRSAFQHHLAFLQLAAIDRISFLTMISRHLSSLGAIISSVPQPHRFPTPFPCPRRPSLQRRCNAASDLTLSSYVPPILYPATPFKPLAAQTSVPAHAILTVGRTLKSHKALRGIFHAAISAGRDERRYPSRSGPIPFRGNREISFEREIRRNFLLTSPIKRRDAEEGGRGR